MTNQDLKDFYKALKKFNNISYATVEDYGEVENYQMAYEELIDSGCQYGVVLEQGYYYEEAENVYYTNGPMTVIDLRTSF